MGPKALGKSKTPDRIDSPEPDSSTGEKNMRSAFGLRANDTMVFIGDSITDAERHRRAYGPLGFGYVHFVGNFLLAKYPQLNLSIINAGVGGDTILDLRDRWQRECLAHRPDVLSVLVGINDVWRLTMEPAFAENAASPEQYEVTCDQLLSQAKDLYHSRLVLMEPFMFCRDQYNGVFRSLVPYVQAVHRLAVKHRAVLVPLQQYINRQIAEVPPQKWSDDMVHPSLWAHAWIAQRWLEATGL
jgi:lysophospholipase L1-like esterase